MSVTASRASLRDLVNRNAHRDAVALLAPGRAALRYGDLAAHVRDIGAALDAHGVTRSDRVAVAVANGPELATAVLGVAAHATCAPLDARMPQRELVDAFANLRIRCVVAAAGDDHVRSAALQAGVRVIGAQWTDAMPAGLFALDAPRAGRSAPGAGDDVALLLQTSGTTALAKRVPLTHAQLCRSAANISATLALDARDRCLNVMPLFHVHGLAGALLATLDAGASIVCTRAFAAGSFAAWLRAFAPTWYTAVPAIHAAVVDEIEAETVAHALRFIRSASAPLPAKLAARLEAAFGVPVIEAYGMTEAAHQVASNPLPPRPRVAGSVGVATGTEIAILGDDGRRVPPLAVGEIAIRGESVITHYDAAPQINALAFRDGWLLTGDLGSLDDNGYLRVRGRRKDMINRGGNKIMPLEIESILREHEAVADCAVFGIEHPTLGEDVIAAVVLAPAGDLDAIDRWLSSRVYAARMPTRILAIDRLPRSATGKVSRAVLAQALAPQLAAIRRSPRNEAEAAVAHMFAQVLRREAVGADDNFFLLGGDSLTGAQLLARVAQRFGVTLPLATLFAQSTPSRMLAAIQAARA